MSWKHNTYLISNTGAKYHRCDSTVGSGTTLHSEGNRIESCDCRKLESELWGGCVAYEQWLKKKKLLNNQSISTKTLNFAKSPNESNNSSSRNKISSLCHITLSIHHLLLLLINLMEWLVLSCISVSFLSFKSMIGIFECYVTFY